MKTIIIFLISSFYLLISCKKECPSFNRDLLCWLPHSINDTLIFINNQYDTLTFVVNDKNIYDDNTKYGRWNKCQCSSEANVNAVLLQNSDYIIRENILYSNVKEIYFNLSLFFNDKRGEFSLFTMDINENVISSTVIDNHEYKNVIIIENDTIEHPNLSVFWKLIISKDIGLVKIYENGSNNTWTLLE